jgi:hypothetical protein
MVRAAACLGKWGVVTDARSGGRARQQVVDVGQARQFAGTLADRGLLRLPAHQRRAAGAGLRAPAVAVATTGKSPIVLGGTG